MGEPQSERVRRFRLALAAAPGPVSIDALAGTGLWRTAELFGLIEEGRQLGLIAPDAEQGPGFLRWTGPSSRTPTLAAGSPEDFAALLASPPLVELFLAGARSAARERDFRRARVLYGALSAAPDPDLFPGGEATWVASIIESLRLFRSIWAASAEAVEAALTSAESRGDLPAQAVLVAARGLQFIGSDPERAQALFTRATDAAEAVGDQRLRAEVRTYVAVALVLAGRYREGIAAFEEMLGDVPGDLLDPGGPVLDLEGAAPATALGILASAYVYTGDHPRAVDLLERVLASAAQLGNPAMEALARVFLAVAHVTVGRFDAAAPHAEAAHAHWSRVVELSYAWYAALALAAVRFSQGRIDEARALLEQGLPSWLRGGRPWVGGSRALLLLEDLERAGRPPLEGMGFDSEIERHLDAPQPFLAGIAHRLKARRLLQKEGPSSADRAAEHLRTSLVKLRQSGGRLELRLALLDAAELADSRERAAEAERLRAELAELTPAAPLPERAPPDVLRLASAVLDLGRLGALAPRREGVWGEVAARLCREFGAERSALVEARPEGPVLLAVRGPPSWRDALLGRLRAAPPAAPVFEPALAEGAPSGGQLVLVPFADEELGRRGVVALENRGTVPLVGPDDLVLLRALGRQVGILLANVGLWRELQEARQRLEQENRYYRESAPSAPLGGGRIVGDSAALRAVLEQVRRVAPTRTPVLVTGETGVGKELVSREVHLLSDRRERPFIAVHVAALAPGLVASALFGHERGAFTGATEQARGRFELADGGTIFLDEVGELSLDDQVRLLRVLQEGTFERVGGTRQLKSDFRLVAATNRDLAAEVRAGRFREDLYFRLAAFPIRVPPLRERREEIPTLALYFLERASRKLGLRFHGIREADMDRLVGYGWPGNVRELEHVIERATLLSDAPDLRLPPLELASLSPGAPIAAPAAAKAASGAAEDWVSLEEVERRYIRKVLHHVQGRVSGAGGAAELLGLKPSTLQFWIDKLDLREELNRARRRPG